MGAQFRSESPDNIPPTVYFSNLQQKPTEICPQLTHSTMRKCVCNKICSCQTSVLSWQLFLSRCSRTMLACRYNILILFQPMQPVIHPKSKQSCLNGKLPFSSATSQDLADWLHWSSVHLQRILTANATLLHLVCSLMSTPLNP